MKKGKVTAQGTYEELHDNEYMKEVMSIHKSHEKETKDISEKATESKEEMEATAMIESDDEHVQDELAEMGLDSTVPDLSE